MSSGGRILKVVSGRHTRRHAALGDAALKTCVIAIEIFSYYAMSPTRHGCQDGQTGTVSARSRDSVIMVGVISKHKTLKEWLNIETDGVDCSVPCVSDVTGRV